MSGWGFKPDTEQMLNAGNRLIPTFQHGTIGTHLPAPNWLLLLLLVGIAVSDSTVVLFSIRTWFNSLEVPFLFFLSFPNDSYSYNYFYQYCHCSLPPTLLHSSWVLIILVSILVTSSVSSLSLLVLLFLLATMLDFQFLHRHPSFAVGVRYSHFYYSAYIIFYFVSHPFIYLYQLVYSKLWFS